MQRRILLSSLAFLTLVFAARAGRAEQKALGSFRGQVKMTSSVAIPGFLPREKQVTLHMTLTRNGNALHVATTSPDALGGSMTVQSTGTITGEHQVPGGTRLEVRFAGPPYVREIEAQVNQGLAQTSLARGVHVPITDASGLTKLTFLGSKLLLDSSTVIKRAGIGGLRGLVADRLLPREIQNGFLGELTLAP